MTKNERSEIISKFTGISMYYATILGLITVDEVRSDFQGSVEKVFNDSPKNGQLVGNMLLDSIKYHDLAVQAFAILKEYESGFDFGSLPKGINLPKNESL